MIEAMGDISIFDFFAKAVTDKDRIGFLRKRMLREGV